MQICIRRIIGDRRRWIHPQAIDLALISYYISRNILKNGIILGVCNTILCQCPVPVQVIARNGRIGIFGIYQFHPDIISGSEGSSGKSECNRGVLCRSSCIAHRPGETTGESRNKLLAQLTRTRCYDHGGN